MTKDLITNDIVFAAYLKFKGYALSNIERHGNRGTFTFRDVVEDDRLAYDLGKATVEPIAFHDSIKALTTAVKRA